MKENTAALHVHLPVDTATFLLNEKRYEINAIETRLGTPVLIIPDPTMETPHYHVRRLRSEEYDEEIDIPSHEVELVEEEKEEPRHHGNRPAPLPQAEKAAVQSIAHTTPPPPTPAKAEAGFFSRLFKLLFGAEKMQPETKPATVQGRGQRPPQHARGPHPQRRPDNREHRGPRPPHRGNQQPQPRPQHPARAEGRPEGRPQPPARPEARPPEQNANAGRPQASPVPKEPSDRPEGASSGRRRRRGRRGRGAGRTQEGGSQRPESQMNVAQPGDEARMPDVERGNEALPPMPANEHRFEEQPQVRVERSSEPESVVHEQPVAVPVQAPSPSVAPVESVAVQTEPQPVATEPKNP
jgi:ribonuclease E